MPTDSLHEEKQTILPTQQTMFSCKQFPIRVSINSTYPLTLRFEHL